MTFVANGGSATAEQTVAYNSAANQPDDPTREDYEFIGWYADASLTTPYSFGDILTADLVLYASWAEIPQESLEYTLSGGIYTVTGIGDVTDTDIVIPSEYNGQAVTGIGEEAFKSLTTLTSVSLPSSIVSIGASAFQSCSALTAITYSGENLEIGSSAFASCIKLSSIPLSGVTAIGYNAFYYCTSLTSVSLGGELL